MSISPFLKVKVVWLASMLTFLICQAATGIYFFFWARALSRPLLSYLHHRESSPAPLVASQIRLATLISYRHEVLFLTQAFLPHKAHRILAQCIGYFHDHFDVHDLGGHRAGHGSYAEPRVLREPLLYQHLRIQCLAGGDRLLPGEMGIPTMEQEDLGLSALASLFSILI